MMLRSAHRVNTRVTPDSYLESGIRWRKMGGRGCGGVRDLASPWSALWGQEIKIASRGQWPRLTDHSSITPMLRRCRYTVDGFSAGGPGP